MNQTNTAISAINLTKRFRIKNASFFKLHQPTQYATALNALNLSIKQGELFALLGPNGAGKTTFLKIVSGLLLPDSGDLSLYGERSNEIRANALRVSLLLGDDRSFYWRLTGRQNLEFFGALYRIPAAELKDKITSAQAFFKIENLDKPYQEYSSGTRQRIALARCFLSPSKIILMDEPTRNLDPTSAGQFRTLLKTYLDKHPDHTILITTHNTAEAELLADRIGIMNQGNIEAVGTLDELRTQANLPLANLEMLFNYFTGAPQN